MVKFVKNRILYVSVVFTWELPEVKSMAEQKNLLYDKIIAGGPALRLMPDYLNESKVKKGVYFHDAICLHNALMTKTTSGCIRKCGFCAVDRLEGGFKELDDWPDRPILIDNNLLASSIKHFDKVMERLQKHDAVDFNQGLDARLLTDYHAAWFKRLCNPIIRLALDNINYRDQWSIAFEKLRRAGIAKRKIRSYALLGFDSGPDEGWERCNFIESHGIMCLPAWFHPLNTLKKNLVTKRQESLGWTDYERRKIMQYFYWHKKAVRPKNG